MADDCSGPCTDIDNNPWSIKLLVLAAVVAAMAVGLVVWTPSPVQADEVCTGGEFNSPQFCLEKTVSPNPVNVGEPLTFTITGFCRPLQGGGCTLTDEDPNNVFALVDALPPSVEFVSATASGLVPAECEEEDGTVTCVPITYSTGHLDLLGIPDATFVAEIVVIPTECGTFTNTATDPSKTVSENFTVVGCGGGGGAGGSGAGGGDGATPISQESEQDSEAGEIEQTFDVS